MPQAKGDYISARNCYLTKIKKAKINHWNAFLEKEDPQSIFRALAYTNNRQVERIPAIMQLEQ
jgi:hypothetical protein